MTAPTEAATTGRFDTSQFNATGTGSKTEDPKEILAYKRGMDWLIRETPMMEAFIRAWTNKKVNLRVGPIPCTDGDTIYLRPLPLYDNDEPSQKYLAHMWHEMAHVILSQVYEPANSRKVECALKVIGDAKYGKPAGHMWNALEDGRVEDRLYKTAPGARKHIVKDVEENTPKIVDNCKTIGNDFGLEHLLLTCDPIGLALLQTEGTAVTLDNTITQTERAKRLTEISERIMEHARQTGDMDRANEIAANVGADIGILMASYLETAGYHIQAREFETRVVEAITDAEIASAIKEAQTFEKSLPVLHESTRRVLARARELGFFTDWDPRALDPETGEPQVIDWNTLSDEEKQKIRDQLKNQKGMPRIPGQNDAIVVNLPKELMDELRKQMQNQPPQKGNDGPKNQNNPNPNPGESPSSEPKPGDGSPSSDSQRSDPVDSDDDGAPDGRSAEQKRADARDFAEADKEVAPNDRAGGQSSQSSSESVDRSDQASSSVGTDAEESDGLDQIQPDQAGRGNDYEAPAELKEAYAEKNAKGTTQDTTSQEADASVAPTSSGEPSEDEDSPKGKGQKTRPEMDEDFDDNDEGFGLSGDEDEDWQERGNPSDEDEDFDEDVDDEGDASESNGSAQSGRDDEERNAQMQHEYNEEARIKRVEKFREKFGEIEDTIRPPHIEYVTKDEAKQMEAQDDKAQVIKEAMQIEVGEISGSPENKFLFKQRKMQINQVEIAKAPDLSKYDDVLAGEANRLRAIFKQNKKSGFGGQFEIGSHIKGSALPGFITGEHLKPFDRRWVNKKLDYSVTLLIDQSGSMYGSKIEMARTALAMQASLLDKLAIPFEILGFSTKASGGGYSSRGYWDYKYLVQHDVFKSFEEGWTPEQRAKVMSITTNDSNLDGLALSWAWDRMQKRHEKVKILMTYSDGQPNPDTDNQIRIMKHIIRKMTQQGAIAIGVGVLSHAPEQLYPKSVYCSDVRTLPRLVTKALEEELSKKR